MYKITILKEDIAKIDEQISQNKLFSTRKSYVNYLCSQIALGKFDNVVQPNQKSKKVYAEKELVKKARNHAKKLGYGTLQEMMSDILKYVEEKGGFENEKL